VSSLDAHTLALSSDAARIAQQLPTAVGLHRCSSQHAIMLPLSTTTRAQGRRPLAAPQRQAHARQHTASRRCPTARSAAACAARGLEAAAAHASDDGPAATRRHALLASAALILTGTLAPAWPATSSPYTRDPRLRPLQEFWAQLVTFLQPQLSGGWCCPACACARALVRVPCTGSQSVSCVACPRVRHELISWCGRSAYQLMFHAHDACAGCRELCTIACSLRPR
jgi:hypothetical protein